MDSWNKFNEISLPNSNVNIKYITEKKTCKGDKHAKIVWNIFNMNNIVPYHDMQAQSDTLLSDIISEKHVFKIMILILAIFI